MTDFESRIAALELATKLHETAVHRFADDLDAIETRLDLLQGHSSSHDGHGAQEKRKNSTDINLLTLADVLKVLRLNLRPSLVSWTTDRLSEVEAELRRVANDAQVDAQIIVIGSASGVKIEGL